jgi:hypothetical protein
MSVNIGHARMDENNKARGGVAGDNNSKEVCITSWYNKPWTAVIRPKNKTVAEKIAKAVEQACANNNIGYDQGDRTTLYSKAKAVNWDLSKIVEKCECDCSSLVAVCVNAAGVSVSKDMYTGNELDCLKATNKFDIYTSSTYTKNSNRLKRGDILLGAGHTAIVVSNNTNSSTTVSNSTVVSNTKIQSAKSFSKSISGTYKTTSNLNIRCGAGTSNTVLTVIPKNEKVVCYGYYTSVNGIKWYLIVYDDKHNKYTGFVNSKYLKK